MTNRQTDKQTCRQTKQQTGKQHRVKMDLNIVIITVGYSLECGQKWTRRWVNEQSVISILMSSTLCIRSSYSTLSFLFSTLFSFLATFISTGINLTLKNTFSICCLLTMRKNEEESLIRKDFWHCLSAFCGRWYNIGSKCVSFFNFL